MFRSACRTARGFDTFFTSTNTYDTLFPHAWPAALDETSTSTRTRIRQDDQQQQQQERQQEHQQVGSASVSVSNNTNNVPDMSDMSNARRETHALRCKVMPILLRLAGDTDWQVCLYVRAMFVPSLCLYPMGPCGAGLVVLVEEGVRQMSSQFPALGWLSIALPSVPTPGRVFRTPFLGPQPSPTLTLR